MERELPHAIYAAPAAGPPRSADAKRLQTRSFVCGALAVGVFIGAIVVAMITDARAVLLFGGLASAVLALAALVQGAAAFAGATTAGKVALGFGTLFNVAMMAMGSLLAWLSTMSFTRGRQLRRFGKVLLPPVEPGSAWAHEELRITDDLDDSTREGLAAQWRENGRTEHASVAAFARLTLDLIALGAPPALIAAAQRDALDEIRHAELCFSLARAIDGKAEGPGSFPEASRARTLSKTRPVALVELAVDSLIDGALHEGVSARIVAKLARRAVDPTLRSALRKIAADEGRHAAHGWDVVRWCLAEGGAPVAHALASALEVLPETMATDLPEAARLGGWERFGIMGHALERAEHAKARALLERRVRDLVAPYVRAAA